MNLELVYSNDRMLNNLRKTREQNNLNDSVKYNDHKKHRLGQFNKEFSGQTKGQDFLYMQNLYEYKYGHDNNRKKGLIGTIHNYPQVLKVPTEYVDNKKSRLIDSQLEREIEVSGVIYKVKDLPIIKPRVVSR